MVTFWEFTRRSAPLPGDDITVAKYYDFDKDFLIEWSRVPRTTRYTKLVSPLTIRRMSNAAHKRIESFVSKLKTFGVPIREEDNKTRLELFEGKLPNRLPQSFGSFLSRYSFPAFDVVGISLFGWESASNLYAEEASAPKGSLSELLVPAGYVQIGRPDTGDFDAVCFDLNDHCQNREYRIVRVDHEDILCNWRVRVSGELWPSFIKLVDNVLSSAQPQVSYEDPSV
jgi:hypothetical protein